MPARECSGEKKGKKPPKRNWEPTQPFFDLQFSHVIEVFLTVVLEVMEDHIRTHVLKPQVDQDSHQGAEQLIEIIHTYLK